MTDSMRTIHGDPSPADIAAAASILFYRCGDPEVEVRRRGALRGTLRASRDLARALEEFTRNACAHYQGVHSTPHMRAEVEALARTFSDWSFSVHQAACIHRECRGEPTPEASADAHPPSANSSTGDQLSGA